LTNQIQANLSSVQIGVFRALVGRFSSVFRAPSSVQIGTSFAFFDWAALSSENAGKTPDKRPKNANLNAALWMVENRPIRFNLNDSPF